MILIFNFVNTNKVKKIVVTVFSLISLILYVDQK
jgi:uncharacterized protein YaiL (DUF2058 family)